MKETVITWTVANWVTVFLMFITMSLFIGLVMRVFHSMRKMKEE